MAVLNQPRLDSVAERALEIVRRRPGITLPQIVDELSRVDEPDVVVGVLGDALEVLIEVKHSRRGAVHEAAELEPPPVGTAWGGEPSDEQLTEARSLGATARRQALSRVLAGAITRRQAADHLGITAQAVSDRLKAGRLLALRRGREWRFPSWQFTDDNTLPGLGAVIAAWPSTPLSLSIWAVTPSADLGGRTPEQELKRRGEPERVLELEHALVSAGW